MIPNRRCSACRPISCLSYCLGQYPILRRFIEQMKILCLTDNLCTQKCDFFVIFTLLVQVKSLVTLFSKAPIKQSFYDRQFLNLMLTVTLLFLSYGSFDMILHIPLNCLNDNPYSSKLFLMSYLCSKYPVRIEKPCDNFDNFSQYKLYCQNLQRKC